ncbi:DUF2529 domain-containing protein [Sutcliffiella cohnii]
MLKIFTTQLQGSFQKIAKEEEFSFEDGARLLAQAIVGEGDIYIYGSREMQAVVAEALYGVEPLPRAKALEPSSTPSITNTDRALVVTRCHHDEEAIQLVKKLSEKGVSVVAISSVMDEETTNTLVDLADVHIDLQIKKGLLPDEEGGRFGFPTSMVALYAYYGLAFTVKETIDEQF